MDYFIKRSIVLKQNEYGYSQAKPVGGIVKIEKCGKEMYAELNVLNLAEVDEGYYELGICGVDRYIHKFRVKNFQQLFYFENEFPDITEGCAAVIVYCGKQLTVPVAKGICGNISINFEEMNYAFNQWTADGGQLSESSRRAKDSLKTENCQLKTPDANDYQDEVVATENYYLLEENIPVAGAISAEEAVNETTEIAETKAAEVTETEILEEKSEIPFKGSFETVFTAGGVAAENLTESEIEAAALKITETADDIAGDAGYNDELRITNYELNSSPSEGWTPQADGVVDYDTYLYFQRRNFRSKQGRECGLCEQNGSVVGISEAEAGKEDNICGTDENEKPADNFKEPFEKEYPGSSPLERGGAAGGEAERAPDGEAGGDFYFQQQRCPSGIEGGLNEKENFDNSPFEEYRDGGWAAEYAAGAKTGADFYYDKVESDLNRIFEDYEKEEFLTSNIPNSKWAKIPYNGNMYYVVGVIKLNGRPAYICYGVPSGYSKNPPPELKDCCSYFPKNLFEKDGDGYFIMYQDAETGECIML